MKTHLLIIPSKKTEEIDWVKPLNNYLVSIYGNTSSFQQDVNQLNKLRQDLRGVNSDRTGLRLYFKYYSELELLDLRVPFHSLNRSKKLEFIWYDSFSHLKHSQHALPFEKANILYNTGSLLSKLANNKYSHSDFKDVIQMLQQASGIFDYINENFLHAPSDDLNQSTIRFLSKLMLSQSQEIFTLKVISDDLNQSKNSLISKLCKSTSGFYEDCYNMFKHEDESDDDVEKEDAEYVTGEIDESWISIIYFKYQFYKSLSFYFNGLQLEANRKYGDAIAYLTKSQEYLQIDQEIMNTISKGSGDVYELLDNFKYQSDAVGIKIQDLTKDNDLIYHDLIPNLATLPMVKGMDSTKMIDLSQIDLLKEVNEESYNSFLKNVVPMDIHEMASFYSEEKSQLLRNEIDFYEISKEEAASVLEHLKLPSSLYKIKEKMNKSISSDVLNMVSEISSSNNQDKSMIESLKQQIYHETSLLDQQKQIEYKKCMYDASKHDRNVDPQLLSILSKGPNSIEFRNMFKDDLDISLLDIDDSQDEQISNLEQQLYELNSISKEKSQIISNLKTEIHNDDISDILILNSKFKNSHEIKTIIFPEELKKFDKYNQKLDHLVSQEKEKLKLLQHNYTKLLSSPSIKKLISSKSESEEEKIRLFYQDWKKYKSNLSKGLNFYKGLLNEIKQNQQPSLPQRPPKEEYQRSYKPPPKESNLIYDQPSRYDPNMYDFFSKTS